MKIQKQTNLDDQKSVTLWCWNCGIEYKIKTYADQFIYYCKNCGGNLKKIKQK